ncbi:type I-F CRISPR-associated endoribonuclease Cas6/Csy4 [Pseudomonas veronii]|uniref:type I-F CRISPR-associated endoribonuclease Cas6/Csy4 n=1 Tax=Pseudomonas veronii TaxID=76761 RepID=UPI00159F84D3|nr:type I-F CRISPR-associated endoribonuclease Cas6/Csy4 [Pseudomonas veronii]NWD59262.1 type I-F CRISPR-associated endoribonuclease Cas6/Csy4 [Pseudomonas veronii]
MILHKYIEVRASDPVIAKKHFVRVMLVVHCKNSGGAQLVVDWPKWASSANYFGVVMRVFGTEEELQAIKIDLDGEAMKASRVKGAKKTMIVSPVTDVPNEAKITWIFKRHRTPGRNKGASGVARLIRRAIARGEEPKEYAPKVVETHTLMLVSLSTNKIFPMDICRERPTHQDVIDSTPNSYGLGVPVPRF